MIFIARFLHFTCRKDTPERSQAKMPPKEHHPNPRLGMNEDDVREALARFAADQRIVVDTVKVQADGVTEAAGTHTGLVVRLNNKNDPHHISMVVAFDQDQDRDLPQVTRVLPLESDDLTRVLEARPMGRRLKPLGDPCEVPLRIDMPLSWRQYLATEGSRTLLKQQFIVEFKQLFDSTDVPILAQRESILRGFHRYIDAQTASYSVEVEAWAEELLTAAYSLMVRVVVPRGAKWSALDHYEEEESKRRKDVAAYGREGPRASFDAVMKKMRPK